MQLMRNEREYIERIINKDPPESFEQLHVVWVGRQRCLPGYAATRNEQSFLRFLLVAEGILELRLADRSWTVPKGSVVCFPPHCVPSYTSPGHSLARSSFLGLDGPLTSFVIKELAVESSSPVLRVREQEVRLDALLRRVQKELSLKTPGFRWRIQGLVWEFLGELKRGLQPSTLRANSVADETKDDARHKEFDPRIERAVEYIDLHFARTSSVDDLAGVAGLSRSHFSVLFAQCVGLPPRQYLEEIRVSHAKDLLATSELPVRVVGTSVGFHSPGHFARIFSRHEGITPSQYRGSLQGS